MIKLLLTLCAALTACAAEPNIDQVFDRLYDFRFAESQTLAQAYIDKNNEDPMGYASLAASWMFSEMNRLQVFNKDLFKSDKQPDRQAGIEAKRSFEDALNRAKNAGELALKRNSKDTNALLALVIATGAERDFAALIEKRYKDSYDATKASQTYALALQAIDPNVEDAWFTRGFSEYLVGSMPGAVRWLMRIDQVQGNKDRGVEFMTKCASTGRYLKPFAQMMLATIFQKEKRLKESRQILEAFAAEHPGNETVRRELAKLPKS